MERGRGAIATNVPDHPASSGVSMTTSLVARIASEVQSIACVKLESLPSPSRIARLRELWSDAMPPARGGGVAILAGLGAAYSGFEIEEGIDGYMTGFAFPEILVAMCDAARGGDVERAHAIYSRYLPLVVYEGMSPGVALRKELYRMRGLVDCAIVRHPAEAYAPASLVAGLERQIARSFPGMDITRTIPASMFV